MKKEIFSFLKEYSYGTIETNRLVVSSFLYKKNITHVKNELISLLLIKESDDDFAILQKFNTKYSLASIEELITAFEYIISPEEKVISGAVYTPKTIRDFIIKSLFDTKSTEQAISICDPACGCGGFLFSSALALKQKHSLSFKEIFSKYLFGIDLMEYSVTRTKILLSIMAIIEGEDEEHFDFNLFVGNSLSFDFKTIIKDFDGFDAIVGNPPYVCSRNIDPVSKKLLLNWKVSETGHPDLYIPFFEIGMNLLKDSGFLGYITMNSFFKSLNGRALRSYFSEKLYNFTILDFGGLQVFDSRSTYTCICFIEKKVTGEIRYKKLSSIKKLTSKRTKKTTYEKLDDYNGWNFQSFKIVNKIENTGQPFAKVFKSSNGIATLKNSVFIIEYDDKDTKYYHLEDGQKIEKSICVDIFNPNKLIRTDNIDSLKKKIIHPYDYSSGKAVVIPDNIMQKDYPEAYQYLLNHKQTLSTRDKGKGIYPEWYAYGRTQGLDKSSYKLFFPHITPVTPNYTLSEESLLFHNGMALVSENKDHLILAQKIMSSKLFWFYIVNTSKPYGSGYFSLSRNYIKSFGIYDFNEQQIEYLLQEDDQNKVDKFLEQLYGIEIPS